MKQQEKETLKAIEDFKNIIDSSWKTGRYILSTDKVEQLRVLITKALQDTIKDTEERVIGEVEKVNRVEVIDHTKNVEDGGGRVYTKWEDELDVKLDIQDEGRTLKIFINKLKRK